MKANNSMAEIDLYKALESGFEQGLTRDRAMDIVRAFYNKKDKILNHDIIYKGTHGSCSWNISGDGTLTIYPTNGKNGVLNSSIMPEDSAWNKYSQHILSVTVKRGVSANIDAQFLFYKLKNCKSMELSNLDTRRTSRFNAMFFGCESLTDLNISNFDTGNATNMRSMFAGCKSLTELDLSNFNTSKVFNMIDMFRDCENIEKLNVSSFNMLNITSDKDMFKNCFKINSLNVYRELYSKQLQPEKGWNPPLSKNQDRIENKDDLER